MCATLRAAFSISSSFILGASLAVACLTGTAKAEVSVADFYKANPISIVVGYAPGGGYDATARLLARYLGRHIPGNPNIIIRNMPGAGSVVAANFVYNTSPRDGSVLGMYADIVPVAPLMGVKGAQFDPRQFSWLGSIASRGTPVVILRSDAPAKTFSELQTTEVLIGASGPDATSSYALLLNETLGTKMRVVQGYRGGTAEIELAMQRGEVHGRASAEWERVKVADWARDGAINVILQMSLKPHSDLKHVPLALDLAKTESDGQLMELILGTNQFFRAFSGPPGIPVDRLSALREALVKVTKDKDFVSDFGKGYGVLEFASPAEIDTFLNRIYAFAPDVLKRASKFIAP
jgi:tripartite-type tricarboxylate transporter receptor subunit TctC